MRNLALANQEIIHNETASFIKQVDLNFEINLCTQSQSQLQLHPSYDGTFVLIDSKWINANKYETIIKHINLNG